MTNARVPDSRELEVLFALLQSKPGIVPLVSSLDGMLVSPMDDGGMGSLRLYPKGSNVDGRRFGKEIATAEFTDRDGVLVSVSLNIDNLGQLYELDVWKVDFSPLQSLPRPVDMRFAP